jgi:soluble lytic murein transglycosylase-like protein
LKALAFGGNVKEPMRINPAFFLPLLCAPAAVQAGGIYRYVEKDGTIVYTNVPRHGAESRSARRLEGEFRPVPSPAAPARVTASTAKALSEYDDYIEEAAHRYRIPANLVRAVMHAESAFDPNAVSVVGASGLMQLMPKTAQEMFVKDIFDVKENIEGGVRYLRVLANEFNGDMVKMVAAYNAGPDAVKKFGGQVPPYAETQMYVRKVLSLYFQYKAKSELAQKSGEATRTP